MVTNSEDSDNERSDNFHRANVTYEFPDDCLETAEPLSIPERDIESNEMSLETEVLNTRPAMNRDSLDPCPRLSSFTSIKTSANKPGEDIKQDDCVIYIGDELVKISSSESLSETNNNLKENSAWNEEDQIRTISNAEDDKIDSISGLFSGFVKQSSSSENCFADVEDNAESITSSSDDVHKFYQCSCNNNSPTKSNPSFQKSNNYECKISAKPETTAVQKSNASASSTSPNFLKVRSGVTRNKKRRCGVCKKRLNLAAITCRCGGMFCSKHRYSNEHGCTFDYKAMGAEKIKKENPQVVAEKVHKI